jgi:hypothetical protein
VWECPPRAGRCGEGRKVGREVSLITPSLSGTSADPSVKYRVKHEGPGAVAPPAAPSNGGPNRRVRAPAARERAVRQEALQEVEMKRRKEDLAVEESVKEVLAWAQVHRPKNTTRAYLPKQREWKVGSPLQCLPILLLYSSTTNL